MEISYVKQAIEAIFSESGYKIDNFTLFCPPSLDVKLSKTEEGIHLDFSKIMPSVKTKKLLLPITAYVEGLFLGATGGTIKLKYFPDFSFKYSGFTEKKFGVVAQNSYTGKIKEDIIKEYPDAQRRKIAILALQYASEWGKIVSQNDTKFEYCKKSDKEYAQKNCYNFVYENIVNSKEIQARSAVLTFILVYLVLPAIISWVVKKFLDNFFN